MKFSNGWVLMLKNVVHLFQMFNFKVLLGFYGSLNFNQSDMTDITDDLIPHR